MPSRLKEFIKRWLINTVAVLATTHILSGISYDTWQALLIATLLLGILNALLRPLKIIFGLVTLGVFTWVVNALLLLLVGAIVDGFSVASFWYAMGGALLISLISITLSLITGTGSSRVYFRSGPRGPPGGRSGGAGGGDGSVIDV